MLYKKTVSKSLLELIVDIQSLDEFDPFFLVGGTALALQMGHRRSVDIDLFTTHNFDSSHLSRILNNRFKNFKSVYQKGNTLICTINGIKVDCIKIPNQLTAPLVVMENIRMASLSDIFVMKLDAIYGNGTRIKDYIDVYYLLNKFTLDEIILKYRMAFPNNNSGYVIQSLIYFNDVIKENWPEMSDKSLTWDKVKQRLNTEVKEYLLSERKRPRQS